MVKRARASPPPLSAAAGNAPINVGEADGNGITVTVRTLRGQEFVLCLDAGATMAALKEAIAPLVGLGGESGDNNGDEDLSMSALGESPSSSQTSPVSATEAFALVRGGELVRESIHSSLLAPLDTKRDKREKKKKRQSKGEKDGKPRPSRRGRSAQGTVERPEGADADAMDVDAGDASSEGPEAAPARGPAGDSTVRLVDDLAWSREGEVLVVTPAPLRRYIGDDDRQAMARAGAVSAEDGPPASSSKAEAKSGAEDAEDAAAWTAKLRLLSDRLGGDELWSPDKPSEPATPSSDGAAKGPMLKKAAPDSTPTGAAAGFGLFAAATGEKPSDSSSPSWRPEGSGWGSSGSDWSDGGGMWGKSKPAAVKKKAIKKKAKKSVAAAPKKAEPVVDSWRPQTVKSMFLFAVLGQAVSPKDMVGGRTSSLSSSQEVPKSEKRAPAKKSTKRRPKASDEEMPHGLISSSSEEWSDKESSPLSLADAISVLKPDDSPPASTEAPAGEEAAQTLRQMSEHLRSLVTTMRRSQTGAGTGTTTTTAAAPVVQPPRRARPPQRAGVDPDKLSQLTDMGFAESGCKRALLLHHNNLEAATEWLLVNMEDPRATAPLTEDEERQLAAAGGGGGGGEEDEGLFDDGAPEEEAVVREFMAMGLCGSEQEGRAAFRAANGNVGHATMILAQAHGQGQSGDDESEGADPDSVIAALASNPSVAEAVQNPRVVAALHKMISEPDSAADELSSDPEIAEALQRLGAQFQQAAQGVSPADLLDEGLGALDDDDADIPDELLFE
jgi:UBA-like domain